MKKIALAALLGLSFAAQAAHYDIKMLNSNSEGSMVFEPGYLKVQPGDTVTFRPENKSHFVHSKAIPEGAQKFQSEEGAYFAADNVGVAGVGIQVTRAMDSEDFAGTALQAAAKYGKYLPDKNKKAILKAKITK